MIWTRLRRPKASGAVGVPVLEFDRHPNRILEVEHRMTPLARHVHDVAGLLLAFPKRKRAAVLGRRARRRIILRQPLQYRLQNKTQVRTGDRQIRSGQSLRTFFEKMAEEGGLRTQRLLPCAMVFHASQWK